MTKSDASVLRLPPSRDNQHLKKSAREIGLQKNSHTVKDELGAKCDVACLIVCTTLEMSGCVHVEQLLQFLSAT